MDANSPSVEFTNDDEVNAALARSHDRDLHARYQSRWPHAGIKIENKAELHLRRDFGSVRIPDLRQPTRAEENRSAARHSLIVSSGSAVPVSR